MPLYLPAAATGVTIADWIEETRRHLLSGAGETLNTIADTTSTATTVTLQRAPLAGVQAGSVLSVGLEAMHVWRVVSATAGTVEVVRGYQGSTPSTHAAGDLVRVNPPHTDHAIFRALNAEVAAMSGAGFYAERSLDLTTSDDGTRTYDLASDVLELYDLRYDAETTGNQWPHVPSYTLLPDALAAEFPSGRALRIDSAVPSGRPLRLLYKAALGLLTGAALGDDAGETTGLLASAHDIPPLGAAWRLTMPSEVERNQTRRQGDSRRAEEVPSGAKMRAGLGLADLRTRRYREELANLTRRWPPRRAP